MLELRHLKTLHALRENDSLVAAADQLCITASALSHQLRELEQTFGLSLLNRKSKPMQFTLAGQRLLSLADQILPLVQTAQTDLKRLAHGHTGRLLLASECHSCFDWLMPVLNRYRQQCPDVDLDFANGFDAQPHQQLQQGEIDVLITADCPQLAGLLYQPLFDYESRLVLAPTHPLTTQAQITPLDVAKETLIAYPVVAERLDIVHGFLSPVGLQPAKIRTTELTPMLIQLVASGRGVAALPDWVVAEYEQKGWVVSRRISPTHEPTTAGLIRTLYAATRQTDAAQDYMQHFLRLLQHLTSVRKPLQIS